jgi:hypothetical protein
MKEDKVIEYKQKKEDATNKKNFTKVAVEKYKKEKDFLMPRLKQV